MPEAPTPNDLTTPQINTQSVRADFLRGDIAIEVAIIAGLAQIADFALQHRLDDLLRQTMADAREHMISGLGLVKQLEQAKVDAAMNAEAAIDFRAQRDRRKA